MQPGVVYKKEEEKEIKGQRQEAEEMCSVLSEVDDVVHTAVALACEGIYYYGEKRCIFFIFLYFEEERLQMDVEVAKRKRRRRREEKKSKGPKRQPSVTA